MKLRRCLLLRRQSNIRYSRVCERASWVICQFYHCSCDKVYHKQEVCFLLHTIMTIMIIYNSTWSILIQLIRVKFSGYRLN